MRPLPIADLSHTTFATEGFRGNPGMSCNSQARNELFRLHRSESTSPRREIVLRMSRGTCSASNRRSTEWDARNDPPIPAGFA